MKIVINFVGGSLHDRALFGDTEQAPEEREPSVEYFHVSNCGEVGRRFPIDGRDDSEVYEVVRRAASSRCVYLRAQHVAG